MSISNFEVIKDKSIQSGFKALGEKYSNNLSSSFVKEFSYRVKKGMGITIGNALRRTLLGQVSGYAIRYVNINNVNHEFSSISGMQDSVQSLIMNLRKIVFKDLNKTNNGRAFLSIKNVEGQVFANEIKSSEFTVVNPSQYLCTLTKDVDLRVEMYIEKGIGYILSSNVSSNEYESDAIICDSFFSPIDEVNFNTESIENNQYDEELFLSVKTNGSVTPDEVMDEAIIIWKEQLARISSKIIETKEDDNIEYIGSSYKPIRVHNAYLDSKIKSIPDMTSRMISCLEALDVQYVGQLVTMTEDDLLKKPNFGQGSLKQLMQILNNIGLSLGMVLDNWQIPALRDDEQEEVLIR